MSALEILSRTFKPLEIPRAMPKGRPLYAGVYLLVDGAEIVYVGSSTEVEMRIWYHSHELRPSQGGDKQFDRVLWLALPAKVLAHYEGAFIRRLAPKYNRRAPRYHGYDNEILDGFGLESHADIDAVVEEWKRRVSEPTVMSRRRNKEASSRASHPSLDTSPGATPQDISTHCANSLSRGAMLIGGGL